uniref:Phosphogluco-mutase n=1 Tax=Rhizophora mucronata TaxID=61149 RepID=A0A2P2LS10_RHIMU
MMRPWLKLRRHPPVDVSACAMLFHWTLQFNYASGQLAPVSVDNKIHGNILSVALWLQVGTVNSNVCNLVCMKGWLHLLLFRLALRSYHDPYTTNLGLALMLC